MKQKSMMCACGHGIRATGRFFQCSNCGNSYDSRHSGYGRGVPNTGERTKQKSITQLKMELRAAQNALDARNNKDGRINDAMAYPPLSSTLWKFLRDQGFKTGSEVYAPGIKSADEDWCINCSPQAFRGYAAGIDDTDYFESNGFASLYARDGDNKPINILCFSDYELFEAWHKTTQVMENLTHTTLEDVDYSNGAHKPFASTKLEGILEKKWCRTRLFQALRDILWPVKALAKDLNKHDALKKRVCKRCGRKAQFFSSWPNHKAYLDSGICERCTEEKVQESVFPVTER